MIHLAFKHDIAFSGDFQGAADADRRAVEAFGDALAGSDRPFVIASGTLGLRPGRVATERDGPSRPRRVGRLPRPGSRLATAELVARARRPRRALVGRAAPADRARRRRHTASSRPSSASPATRASPATSATAPTAGRPCTASTPRALFRLALERRPAGSALHAVADEGVPIRDDRRGRSAGTSTCRSASIAPEDAAEHFGWLAGFLGADSPASSALTRELLGWQPTQPGLIDDLEQGHYFRDES